MTTYFDHAECPHCGARFDPEQIGGKKGEATCPACQGDLGVKGIFGVSDSFVGVGDDEGKGLTLDDLMPGSVPDLDTSGYGDQDPNAVRPRRKQPRRITAGKKAPATSGVKKAAAKPAPAPEPDARTSVLDGEGPTGSVALDALKSLKKKP